MLSTLSISDFFRKVTSIAQSFISFGHKVREINREKVQVKVQFFSPNLTIRALMKTTTHIYFEKNTMISYRSRHIRPYIWTLSKVFYCIMTSYLILHCDWHGEIRAHKKHYYLSGKKLKSGNIAVEWEPVPWAGVGSGALQICLCCAGLRLWAMQCLWLRASELSHRECQNASLAIVSMIKSD